MRQYRRKLALHRHGFSYERRPSTLFHVIPNNHQSQESVHLPYQQPSICYPRETPSDEEEEGTLDYHTPIEEPEDDITSHLSLDDCDATRNFVPGSEPDPTGATEEEGPGTSQR